VSRIGKKPVTLPNGVTVSIADKSVSVKGPKGELSFPIYDNITVVVENGEVIVTRANDLKENRALHGLTRACIQNMVIGVTEGFSKTLDIVGVGYRAEMKGTNLLLTVGYSHPIYFMPPDGITLVTPTVTQIVVNGVDKQVVGQVASKLRSFRKPEPYKGKGIKYSTEVIRRKAGKTAGK
jgi:large subunit ribosomal protein L6